MRIFRHYRLFWIIAMLAGSALAAVPAPRAPNTLGPLIMIHPQRIAHSTAAHPIRPFLVQWSQSRAKLAHGANARTRRGAKGLIPTRSARLSVSSSPSGCGASSGFPAPIAALAASLKCDPDLIFEYVYNNIEFEPLYGSNKGPLGTLLDRRGDDADQVQLLVTLWNAAGYSAAQTGYNNNAVTYTGAEVASWFGVPNDCAAMVDQFNGGGFVGSYTCNTDGTLNTATLNHFFAAIQLGGTWYYFDPSFKYHTMVTGLSSLASVLGYSQSQFLADAGGTVDPTGYSISNVNRAQLRADLTSYATNLLNYINQNNRAWTVGNIIGGKLIQPLTGSPIRITEPTWSAPWSSFPTACPYQSPANPCRTSVIITMPGASTSQTISLYTDQVYGHRITISMVPSGAFYAPTLLIDGAAPGCTTLPTPCLNVGTAEYSGYTSTVGTQIYQTNQPTQTGTCNGFVECQPLTITWGANAYLISLGVGQVGRGMAEYHRQLLAQARAMGNADISELVLGENLAAISYNWIAEVSNQQQVTDQLTQTATTYNFAIGLTGQVNILQLGYEGPYVDLPMNLIRTTCSHSSCPSITINGNSYPANTVAAGTVETQIASALESGVLLQTQAPVANVTAASTMTLLDANMNSSYPGALDKTYFADGTTAAGRSYYSSTIYPAIYSHYGASDLAAIGTAVSAGEQVLIPANGELAVGLWHGAGYTISEFITGPGSLPEIGIFQLITGGMSGGFIGIGISDPAPNTEATLIGAPEINSLSNLINSIPSLTDPQTLEPVDSITGAYTYSHNDLTTGGNGFPYALPFSRTYLSSSGSFLTTTTADIGMGNGWSDSYSFNAAVNSDPYVGMGSSDSPASSAVTSIAALYVMQDLTSSVPSVPNLTAAAMTAHWFADQLNSNIVLVNKPDTSEEYVSLPHGDGATSFAFNPPPGSSVRFSQVAAGQYSYEQKDGVTLNFGASPIGDLQNIVYPNGMTVNLTYSSGKLAKVTNNLGRSLTLSYSPGGDVAAVEDDSGRSVTYGYDGNHNLTSFTDPLGFATTFAYDTTGFFDSNGHLTQVYYPTHPHTAFVSNTYDALGRVAFQANANGNVSDFYFAGSRTELVDATGNRQVTYQTDIGRVIMNAWVLSSGFGDVFSDTAQQNGTVNVWSNQYDGIGRLTLSTAPEGDSTAYTYATTTNPWANNIASITLNPKPGSSLSPLVETFTYDPNWNKIATVTDPLGLVSENVYGSTTGSLIRSTADYSNAAGHLNATSLFTYNTVGQVLTATDPLGAATEFVYDGYGNQTSVTRDYGRLNQLTTYGYDDLGDVASVTDPNGNVTTNTYDADRRLNTVTLPFDASAPGPLVTAYTYDPDSHVLQTQQSVQGTAQRTTSATYTLTGKKATTTDANGNVTTMAYDAVDRLSSTMDATYSTTSFLYDAMSRQTETLNAAIQAAALQTTAYAPDGEIASLTDANGHATSYAYDGVNRLSVATYPAGSGGIGTTTENYTYDVDSNVLSFVTRRGDTFSFAYDTLNRMCSRAIATTATSCSATSSSNPTTWYTHDLVGRIVAANDNGASIVAPSATASYTTNTSYNAINSPVVASWTPASAQTTPSAASVTFQYSYDPDNRRVNQTATDKSWWSYPTAVLQLTYNSNALNQYTCIFASSCTNSLLYDANGNLIYDGTFTYNYDAESRLTGILNGTTLVASYAYDAQDRRKEKTIGSTSTVYVTDAADREVLEYDGSAGTEKNWYAYGAGTNDVLNQMNLTSSTRETMVPDIQGSIVATLDASSGTLTKAAYQTFGENPSLTAGTFRYTGQRFDPETAGSVAEPSGLYYYRARMYSPTLGRFLQTDPSGYPNGMNLYTYVGNDPLDMTDPTGMSGGCFGGPSQCGPAAQAAAMRTGNMIIGGSLAVGACILACPVAGIYAAAAEVSPYIVGIGAVGGGAAGGVTGYHETGTLGGTLLGAGGGASLGALAGTLNPLAVDFALDISGGSYLAGGAAFTSVNAAGGVLGATDASLINGNLPSPSEIGWGAGIGAFSGILEAPFAAAGGVEALGGVSWGNAALSVQTAILGTTLSFGEPSSPPPSPK